MKNQKSTALNQEKSKTVAIIVAHPDDETLWAGGTILTHPTWNIFVITLCRASDTDRAPKFFKALKALGAEGKMGDLDDGPDQKPLAESEVQNTILQLMPQKPFDLIIAHNPNGEYTRHIRHEEVSRAVIKLWHSGKINTNELWTFAYEDGYKQYLPRPVRTAPLYNLLPVEIWEKKYDIVTNTYGFDKESWEAKTTPREEAFWQYDNSSYAMMSL